MARMSVDDSFGRDPRVLRLAKLCGWSRRETMGALLDVWAPGYDRGTPVLPAEDIDTAADLEGFHTYMIRVGLAEEVPEGVRMHGIRDRITYLTAQQESGRRGGLAKAANDRAFRKAADKKLAKPVGTLWPSPSPDPDLIPESDLFSSLSPPGDQDPPERERRGVQGGPPGGSLSGKVPKAPKASKAKAPKLETLRATDPTRAASVEVILAKLGAQAGVAYRGADAHVALICARLDEGKTELQLRYIVGFCASKSGLGWKGDPDMHVHLTPETLFGPRNVDRYLERAEAWALRHNPVVTQASQEAAGATKGAIGYPAPPPPENVAYVTDGAAEDDDGQMGFFSQFRQAR